MKIETGWARLVPQAELDKELVQQLDKVLQWVDLNVHKRQVLKMQELEKCRKNSKMKEKRNEDSKNK